MALHSPSEIKLEAPGAGLPGYELFIARMLFAFRTWRYDPGRVTALFKQERVLVAQLLRQCPTQRLAERVLIPRPRGLEDSSRHWSLLMTLDHLRMVNLGVAASIRELAAGRVPAGKASTANVKPCPEVTSDVIAAYEESCAHVLAAIQGVEGFRDDVRFAHPWFGPLTAKQWHLLVAVHLGLHRRQMEVILEHLR